MTTGEAFLAGAAAGGAAAGAVAWRWHEARAARYGRLLSFALHEINTPMTAVNMTVINLLSGVFGAIPPDQLKWIEMARDSVARLNALADETRDFVHLELGPGLRSTVEPAAPAEIVAETLETLSRGFVHAGIELRVEVAEGLPEVRADRERAVRSLSSLLFHARKFRGGGPVDLKARLDGSAVVFSVEYAGQKLPPDEVRLSLELFHPARERSDKILPASGLGLGLVRAVMRRAGADADLSVDENGSSRLTLRLPLAAEA